MTLREKIIVEVYTGTCMVTGDEREEVYRYMSALMGRPVFTHELADHEFQEKLKEKCKPDFVALCRSSNTYSRVRDDLATMRKEIEERWNRLVNRFDAALRTLEELEDGRKEE